MAKKATTTKKKTEAKKPAVKKAAVKEKATKAQIAVGQKITISLNDKEYDLFLAVARGRNIVYRSKDGLIQIQVDKTIL